MGLEQSEIDICNQAIMLVGFDPITTFVDNQTKQAIACANLFPALRDAMLEEDAWSFSLERVQLAAESQKPVGFAYQFKWPAECITVVDAFHKETMRQADHIEFTCEKRRLKCDWENVWILYAERVKDPIMFSPTFAQALVFRIASELATTLVRSKTLQEKMYGLYMAKLNDAMGANAIRQPSQHINVNWVHRKPTRRIRHA